MGKFELARGALSSDATRLIVTRLRTVKRRDTGMGISDLKGWFLELAGLDNPVRREFHLFTLLSASRPAASDRRGELI
jgi:hypothetical protein